MKIGSVATALALVGCAAWTSACGSDSARQTVDDAGAGGNSATGGKGSGGAAAVGNGGATGGAAGSGGSAGKGGSAGSGGSAGKGGSGGADSGTPTGMPDASVGPDAGDSGANGHDGSAPDGAPKTGCGDLRCYPYPTVLYPAENPASDDKAMLGKFLFWEEQVGELDSMACGTCHRSFAGGSDPRTNDPAAHLPGLDGVLDSAQTLASPSGLTSDDIRGAQGVKACSSPTTVTGTSPQVTTRKPPSYFDAMFNPRNFWDGRAGDCKPGDGNVGGCFYDPDTLILNANAKPLIAGVFDTVAKRSVGAALEAQSVGPPNNPHEMACSDQSWAKIEQKLATVTPLAKAKPGLIPQDMKDFAAKYSTYPKMFAQAFGSAAKISANDPDDVINSQRFAFAIATHERRLTSNQTPFDRWIAGDDAALTPQQLRGYQAFMAVGRCQFCHPPPLFTDTSFHNIGFHKPGWDPGRSAITGQSTDLGKFKTPTLRNVGLREPFGLLHEGEGPGHDLNSVMQLYKQGGQVSDSEIAPLIDPGLLPLPSLTSGDIADIIEFLRNGLTDPRVKDETAPFDRPHLSTE
jgi:cytochrome c peroxidase